MAKTTEIAPDIYRISIYAPWGDLQFNHFLIREQEPLLFHSGLRGMFAEVREAVSNLINLSDLRHISFSHFESDECGSLNEWLAVGPQADVVCNLPHFEKPAEISRAQTEDTWHHARFEF